MNKSLQPTSVKTTDDENNSKSLPYSVIESKFTELTASVIPANGASVEDFDFDLNISEQDFGASSTKLEFTGKGLYDGAEFTFSGPIDLMKMQYKLGEKENETMQYTALVFDEEPFVVTVSEASLKTSIELSAEDRQTLVAIFVKRCESMKSEIQSAHKDVVKEFPMDTMLPFVGLFYATQFANKVKFFDNSIELDFSFDRFDLLKPKQ